MTATNEYLFKVTPDGIRLPRIDGGYRVMRAGGYYIDLMLQLYNWRVVTTYVDMPGIWDRGWCYHGTGRDSFLAAFAAVMAWDGSGDSEPEGWVKNLQTGEYREEFARRP